MRVFCNCNKNSQLDFCNSKFMSGNSEFISPSSDFFPHKTGKIYYRDDKKSQSMRQFEVFMTRQDFFWF